MSSSSSRRQRRKEKRKAARSSPIASSSNTPVAPSPTKATRIKAINNELRLLFPRRIPSMLGLNLVQTIPCNLVGHQQTNIRYNIGASKYGDKSNLGRPLQFCINRQEPIVSKQFGCHRYLTESIPQSVIYADEKIGPLLSERDTIWGLNPSTASVTVPAAESPTQSRTICSHSRPKPLRRHESLLFVSPPCSISPLSPEHRNASPPTVPSSPTGSRSRAYSVDSDGFPTPLSIIGLNKRKRDQYEIEDDITTAGPSQKKSKIEPTSVLLARAERASRSLSRSLFLDGTKPLSGVIWVVDGRDPELFRLFPRETGLIYLSDFKLQLGVFGIEYFHKFERHTGAGWLAIGWNDGFRVNGSQVLLRIRNVTTTSLWMLD